MNRTLLGLAMLAVLAVVGCSDTPAAPVGPDAAPAAPAPRPITTQDLLGRWYPADGTAQGRAFAEFAADGTWTGSDGCNGQRGTWSLGPAGALAGTAGPSTLIACENVPVARWIATSTRLALDGGALVFIDANGVEKARMVRDLTG